MASFYSAKKSNTFYSATFVLSISYCRNGVILGTFLPAEFSLIQGLFYKYISIDGLQ